MKAQFLELNLRLLRCEHSQLVIRVNKNQQGAKKTTMSQYHTDFSFIKAIKTKVEIILRIKENPPKVARVIKRYDNDGPESCIKGHELCQSGFHGPLIC